MKRTRRKKTQYSNDSDESINSHTDPDSEPGKVHAQGLTGLANLGNTCFMNSCIQVLNHTYELSKILNKQKCKKAMKKDTPESKITEEWIDLQRVLWSGDGIVSPNKFVHNVQQIAHIKNRELFTGYSQNDMTEFLLFFIDCIHTSISRPMRMHISGNAENQTDHIAIKCYETLKAIYSTEYSEIMEMFYGLYVTSIHSEKNDATIHSIHPEHFFVLDLQLFSHTANEKRIFTNIYECFDHFITPEFMNGENAWFNENTNEKENVYKKLQFWSLPNILVIVLKRFLPDGHFGKIDATIDFPIENLDLSKYVLGYNANMYVYDLFGVCNHMGGVMGGHYTSYALNMKMKNPENAKLKGQWIHYNDTFVESIANVKETVISPNAYCLFYRKKNK